MTAPDHTHIWSLDGSGGTPISGVTRCTICGHRPTVKELEGALRIMISSWVGLDKREKAVLYAVADALAGRYEEDFRCPMPWCKEAGFHYHF